jgi:Fe2+ or Zn2+ uptake regulation protein
MTPQPLTDKQLKVLKYVKKRATPSTVREIALQVKLDKNTVYSLMTRLTRLGCVESFLKKDPDRPYITAERHYKFITMEPQKQDKLFQKKEDQMYCRKFSKTRVTMPEPFFSDPFNMTGVRDANKDNKRKHKRTRNVQKTVATA